MQRRLAASGCLMVVFGTAAAGASIGQNKQPEQTDAPKLPPAVAQVVKQYRPKAVIDKLTVEKQAGTDLYDIEFKGTQGEMEVAADGTIIDIVSIVRMADLPRPAAEAIQKVTREAGAKILRLEKAEVHSEIAGEKIVRLPEFKYLYEAELLKNGRTGEVTVAPDGTIVEGPKWAEESARYFFAGALPPSTSLRSNFPLPSTKNTHSEDLSQEVVCR